MIRHIILAKLKDGFTRDTPEVRAAAEALAGLGAQLSQPVPGSWATHWGVGTRPISADFIMLCDFSDTAALDSYQADPLHQAVAAQLREVFVLTSGDYPG